MANKKTKKQMFEQILSHTADKEEREFLEKQIAFIDNKVLNKKPTEEQKANEKLKVAILEVIGNGVMTVSDVWKSNGEWLVTYSNQKFSALMNQLVDEGKLSKSVVKRVSYFKVVATSDEVEVDED